MTQNQIAYFKAVNDLQVARSQLAETQRSNRAREKLEGSAQAINKAHYERSDATNYGNLLVNQGTLKEKERSDRANESINLLKARADAALSYATAAVRGEEVALRQEETELKKREQYYTKQKALSEIEGQALTREKVVTEAYSQYLNEAKAQEALASRDLIRKNTDYWIIDKMGSILGGAGKAAAGFGR